MVCPLRCLASLWRCAVRKTATTCALQDAAAPASCVKDFEMTLKLIRDVKARFALMCLKHGFIDSATAPLAVLCGSCVGSMTCVHSMIALICVYRIGTHIDVLEQLELCCTSLKRCSLLLKLVKFACHLFRKTDCHWTFLVPYVISIEDQQMTVGTQCR